MVDLLLLDLPGLSLMHDRSPMTRTYNNTVRSDRSGVSTPTGRKYPKVCMACQSAPTTGRWSCFCKPCGAKAKSRAAYAAAASKRAYKRVMQEWKAGTLDFDNLPPLGDMDLPIELVEEILEHRVAKSDNKAWGLRRDWL